MAIFNCYVSSPEGISVFIRVFIHYSWEDLSNFDVNPRYRWMLLGQCHSLGLWKTSLEGKWRFTGSI